jgi:hypothetical protein
VDEISGHIAHVTPSVKGRTYDLTLLNLKNLDLSNFLVRNVENFNSESCLRELTPCYDSMYLHRNGAT